MPRKLDADAHLVVVQPVMPHYRLPLFRALSMHPKLKAKIFCAREIPAHNLCSVDDDDVNYMTVKTHFWHGLIYQHLPLNVLTAPVLVLPFDLRFLSNYFPLIYRKILNKRTVLWGHGISNRPRPRIVLWIRKLLAQIADAVIFYDNQRKEFFEKELGVNSNKLFVASNTIDLEEINRAIEMTGKKKRTQLLFIGRLTPEKKVHLLIEAFRKISHILPDIGVTIIGDGPEKPRLEQIVSSANLADRVRFTGEITDEYALAEHFAQAIALAYPGNIGLAAVHSLAFGVPVIISVENDHGPEVAVVMNNETGILYPGATAESLAEALGEALQNLPKLAEMGKRGQELVFATFSIQAMVHVFESACCEA